MSTHARPPAFALESTVLLHGVPRPSARALALDLRADARAAGAHAAIVGVLAGSPVVGLSDDQLDQLLAAPAVHKANAANLGILLHSRAHAATTVSSTLELAAGAGLRLAATGGIGGLHRGLAHRLDLSSDLHALARFPVALVASGVKSLLDVEGTRELLEALAVPVIGFRTDLFPAFYRRESLARVDARFDDPHDLAAFIRSELARRTRGILIANPIPADDELPESDLDQWLAAAHAEAAQLTIHGREVTPFILGRLHELSKGQTLRANIALLRHNVRLAAELAVHLAR